MRNSVILVDQIETDRKSGRHTLRKATVEATVRRARPVVLTALVAGLDDNTPDAKRPFWGPMAYTIMGGLFVATLLTLLLFPTLYALWYRRHLDECSKALDDAAPVSEGRLALAAE